MKECELCSYPARLYCESDQASLCWDCDEKVHGANFLVAKHSRNLLCHVCQSQTPWKASGEKLGHTVSVCEKCVKTCSGNRERNNDVQEVESRERNDGVEEEEEEEESEDGEYSSDEEDEVEEEEEDVDGENQVVPWSCTPPPPAVSSSSSEGESTDRFGFGGSVSAYKRMRENADPDSDDDIVCSSSQRNSYATSTALVTRTMSDDEATPLTSSRPLKQLRTTEPNHSATIEYRDEAESKSTAFISSLRGFQKSSMTGDDLSTTILGIRKLSRDP